MNLNRKDTVMPKYDLVKFQQFGNNNNDALELTKDQFVEFITYLHHNSNFKWFNFEFGPQPLLSDDVPSQLPCPSFYLEDMACCILNLVRTFSNS